MFCSEGTGGRPDYHRFPVNHIVAGKFFDGKTGNSRNVCGVSGGSVGVEGMEADFVTGRHPQKGMEADFATGRHPFSWHGSKPNTKRLQIAFAVMGWLQLVGSIKVYVSYNST